MCLSFVSDVRECHPLLLPPTTANSMDQRRGCGVQCLFDRTIDPFRPLVECENLFHQHSVGWLSDVSYSSNENIRFLIGSLVLLLADAFDNVGSFLLSHSTNTSYLSVADLFNFSTSFSLNLNLWSISRNIIILLFDFSLFLWKSLKVTLRSSSIFPRQIS